MAFEGTGDKIQGKAREVKGAVTGDRDEESRGQAQQDRGEVKATVGRAKRKASGKVDEIKGKIKQNI